MQELTVSTAYAGEMGAEDKEEEQLQSSYTICPFMNVLTFKDLTLELRLLGFSL